MANVTNTERLAAIKAALPPGGQAQMAREIGASRAIVCQILSGTRKSPRIADRVMDWFLAWAAARPKVSEVDKALAELQGKQAE